MSDNNLQDSISKTLFIPLAVRAAEMARSHPLIRDSKAAEILVKAEIGNIITNGGGMAAHGIMARTKIIDDEVKNLLGKNPHAVIINLGAGLDTRISRIDNEKLRCFELDLPDVIALRKQYFAENERIRFIPASVLDDAWVRELHGINGDNTIIIAEGLLMYFSESDVRRIFDILVKNFSGAHMYFDVVHSFFIGKGISSTFLWGIDKAKDIESINPDIRLLQSWSTGDLLRKRQSLLFRIMNILPSTRNRSQIMCIQL